MSVLERADCIITLILVQEPNSENCLDFFLLHPCEKVIIIPDTNYITSTIKKIHMGFAKSWYLPKYRPFNMIVTGLRA